MLVIPLIVIVLIIVIVIADHVSTGNETMNQETEQSGETGIPDVDGTGAAGDGEDTSGNHETDNEEEATSPGETPEAENPDQGDGDAFATEQFQRDSVPEILDLMKSYFQARALADAESMNQLYGITGVSGEELEAQKARMRNNAKYISGFENVVTYVMNGTTADSWLVYAMADIKFYTVNTTAPMVMWCYVQKDAEGNYVIMDNSQLSANVMTFIKAANHSQEVRGLAADVNRRLAAALSEDEELRKVYGVLYDGSPVWEDNSNTGSDIVILGEEEQDGNGSEPLVVINPEDGSEAAQESAPAEGSSAAESSTVESSAAENNAE